MLIVKDKLQMLVTGYPTVSDKYNVAGAILAGDNNVAFGDPLMWNNGTQNADGYYVKKAGATVTAANFAGFAVATNVKLAEGFPGTTVYYKPGEALNLLLNGYIAVELAATSSLKATILPGAKLYITPAGALTLTAASNIDTGYTLTGVFEVIEENAGTTSYKYRVEIHKD